MATERFANSAQTTLAADVTSGVTTITVASAVAFPSAPQFHIRIGDELLLVTAMSGTPATSWTVTRGAESTTAAAHSQGSTVTQVLTAGVMNTLGAAASDQSANTVWAGPSSGAAAVPAFRALVSGDLPDNGVTDGKLRDSAALSVIGRASNSTGDPADISASADGQVLKRSSGALAFAALAASDLPGGDWITANTASSTLSATYSITSSGTWADVTGSGGSTVDVSLTAGTWLVIAKVSAQVATSSGTGLISARLYNTTDSAAITDSELAVLASAANAIATGTTVSVVTVASTKTIRLQAQRSSGPTYTTSTIRTGSDGKTTLIAVKIDQ